MTDDELENLDVPDGEMCCFVYEPDIKRNEMMPIYWHIDHDRRCNYYTVAKYDHEFTVLDEAKAFARMVLSLT